MTAQELRIGNWVYNTTTMQNMQVYPMMIPQLHRIKNEQGNLEQSNITPIPLTEEILLKCGFEDVSSYSDFWITIEEDLRIEISLKNDGRIFTSISDIGISDNIKHIHQLQNLYFALTGEELNIEL